jgi:hypothetical protein
MSSMMDGNMNESMRELQMNKMKYCMHKDDIAIGLGRPMYGASVNMCNKKAYPSVISTMGGTNKHVQAWMAVHNFMAETYEDTSNLKNRFVGCLQETYTPIRSSTGATFFDDRDGHASCHQIDQSIRNTMEKKINNMLEFYFVGVSLGIAYAHQHSGDTVASVMVGGLKTVLNGAFQVILPPCVCVANQSHVCKCVANFINQVHTNDLLMFYWDSERAFFEENGGRKDRNILQRRDGTVSMVLVSEFVHANKLTQAYDNNWSDSSGAKLRHAYYERGQGTYPTTSGNPGTNPYT